jgi:hypothetical protein
VDEARVREPTHWRAMLPPECTETTLVLWYGLTAWFVMSLEKASVNSATP